MDGLRGWRGEGVGESEMGKYPPPLPLGKIFHSLMLSGYGTC